MDDVADYIFTRSQENAAKLTDTGELLTSGFIEKSFLHKVIGYRSPHAVYVEYGTHPHMPPVDVIKAWAGRKHLAKGKELDSVAWAIARHIEKYGTPPQPFFRPAIQSALSKFKLR
jgi:hypothetical protein